MTSATRRSVFGLGGLALLALAACDNDCSTLRWGEAKNFVEHYDNIVTADGLILIDVMHANDGGVWGVYKNGAGYGDYEQQSEAKAKAEDMVGCLGKIHK